jgi:hypothetical protein
MSQYVKIIPFELNGDIFSNEKIKPNAGRLPKENINRNYLLVYCIKSADNSSDYYN